MYYGAEERRSYSCRSVPVHPIVAGFLGKPAERTGPVFHTIAGRSLLKRLKELCRACDFEDSDQYKLHSFRHHFASLCANHHIAHRKALAWLGHSSSQMLDLYYHLYDDDSRQAMLALAEASRNDEDDQSAGDAEEDNFQFEGISGARGQSRIEKTLQVPEVQELVVSLSNVTERAGFEPAVRACTRTTV